MAVFCAESSVSPVFQAVARSLDLPYIQTNWEHSESYKGSETSLNFYPEPEILSKALATILKSLQFDSFVVLYETAEGLVKLQEILKFKKNVKDSVMQSVVVRQLVPNEDHRSVLKEIKDMKETQVILDCESDSLIGLLMELNDLGMLEYYYDYFFTSLDANSVDLRGFKIEANITTITLIDYTDQQVQGITQDWELNEFRNGRKILTITPDMIKTETALLHDSMTTLFNVLNDISENTDDLEFNLTCGSQTKSIYGQKIVTGMKSTKTNLLLTGPAEFDEMGRRTNFSIYVTDLADKSVIGTWTAKTPNTVSVNPTPLQKFLDYILRLKQHTFLVSTRYAEPYFMLKKNSEEDTNGTYVGYIVDLMTEIGAVLNYTFKFQPNRDNLHGSYNEDTKEWNGVIGDVIDYSATFGVADLTITSERRKSVDFSLPFMRLGIGLILQSPDAKDKTYAFLEPLTKEVWLYSALVYMIMSVVLWFVARMAPGDWENPDPRNRQPPELENIWNFKNCFWINLGTITNQGSDIYPKGISSRMAASMWWFFALIITNSYIANSASFLTTALQAEINSIEALAYQSKVKYGCLENGATREFFNTTTYPPYRKLYSTMLLTTPSTFVDNIKDGVKRVQKTKNAEYAFFMESTEIDYVIETKCDLRTLNSWLYPQSFGIAMRLNSPHRKFINDAILKLESRGRLLELKKKWWKDMRREPLCPAKKKPSAALSFGELGGLFIVVGVGLGIALFLGLLDFIRHIENIYVNQHISVSQALKNEIKSDMKFWMNTKRIRPKPPSAPKKDIPPKNEKQTE